MMSLIHRWLNNKPPILGQFPPSTPITHFQAKTGIKQSPPINNQRTRMVCAALSPVDWYSDTPIYADARMSSSPPRPIPVTTPNFLDTFKHFPKSVVLYVVCDIESEFEFHPTEKESLKICRFCS